MQYRSTYLVLILLVLSSEGLIDSLVQFSIDIVNNQKAMFIHLVKLGLPFSSELLNAISRLFLGYSIEVYEDMFVF